MITFSGKSPAPGAKNILRETTIEFFVTADSSVIDIDSLIIQINGFEAIKNSEFSVDFDGPNSEITPDGDNYAIVIDPVEDFSLGQIISIQLQVKDVAGLFYNETYSFKIIPLEPQLIDSSPTKDEIISSPQFVYLKFEDLIDGIDKLSLSVSINGLSYILSGEFIEDYNGDLSEFVEDVTSLTAKIHISEQLRIGDYELEYSVDDASGNNLFGKYTFSVDEVLEIQNVSRVEFLGYYQGITKAIDIGIGDSVTIEWAKPLAQSFAFEAFALIYISEDRLSLFDSAPQYIAKQAASTFTISGLTTGKTYSFGVRAFEATNGLMNFVNLSEVETGVYTLNTGAELTATVLSTAMNASISSVIGFPKAGLIKIGSEVIAYNNVLSESKRILFSERNLYSTTTATYVSGDAVELFFGEQDANTVIVFCTPTYHEDIHSGREINSTGIIVPDFSDNDKRFFMGYDFCGYHQTRPQDSLQGNGCGSYLGGEFNGFRGFDLYDRMLGQEEVLLDQVGEPVVLLRRIWDGEKCSCATSRRDHIKLKSCPDCYGTTWVGGYKQYANKRRDDSRIMMAFKESAEDLKLGESEHLAQEFEPSTWTIAIPAIKDRDVIVRFDLTDDIEYIYEVLNVSREKMIYRKFGRQSMAVRRIDKTDILYTLIKSAVIDNTFLPTIQ